MALEPAHWPCLQYKVVCNACCAMKHITKLTELTNFQHFRLVCGFSQNVLMYGLLGSS